MADIGYQAVRSIRTAQGEAASASQAVNYHTTGGAPVMPVGPVGGARG
jgi:hypothetical protein